MSLLSFSVTLYLSHGCFVQFFQDKPPKPFLPDARLMLVAGDNDNYFPNAIYNSTIEVGRQSLAGSVNGPNLKLALSGSSLVSAVK